MSVRKGASADTHTRTVWLVLDSGRKLHLSRGYLTACGRRAGARWNEKAPGVWRRETEQRCHGCEYHLGEHGGEIIDRLAVGAEQRHLSTGGRWRLISLERMQATIVCTHNDALLKTSLDHWLGSDWSPLR